MSTPLVNELRQLWHHLSRRRQRQLSLLFVLLVTSSLSEMLSLAALFPFLEALSQAEELLMHPQWQSLVTFLNIQTSAQLVTVFALGFIATVLLANGLRLLSLHVQTRLAMMIGADLGCQVYQLTLQQPYSFHVRHNSSDLIQMVTNDTNQLSSSILVPSLVLLESSLLIPALVGSLILIDGRIAVSAAVILGSAYVLIYLMRRRLLADNSQLLIAANQRKIKIVQEGLGGIRDVLIASSQDFFCQAYKDAEYSLKHARSTNSIVGQSPRYVVEALALTSIAVLSLTLGHDGDFSQAVPVLGSLALGSKRLVPAFQGGFAALAKIQSSRASLTRVLAALQRPIVSSLNSTVPKRALALENELQLRDVWFRYRDDSDWVLRNLNLTVDARTTVAFVGTTGSGKSTTVDLILGLLQPVQGSLYVDGIALEGESLWSWQRNIAHVPQHIFLSDSTIAENIAFGIPPEKIDLSRVYKAAKLAQIESFIKELPEKYGTYVGERGIRLSGGQRQRIGIARALYRQASIIVFDEATSALDNATERDVMAAISGLSHQFTIILIAHRLSTVEQCDQIVELSQGKVVAQGTYDELLMTSPTFRAMASAS